MGIADEKLQPLLPSDAPTDLLVLARICCDYDPEMRPSFGEMVPQLEAAVAQMKVRMVADIVFYQAKGPLHQPIWHQLLLLHCQ